MSVGCIYQGQAGNQISIYAAARLFAELNSLQFTTPVMPNCFLQTTPCQPGRIFESPCQHFTDQHDHRNFLTPFHGKAHFHGYFQRAKFFYPHRERVKGFFELPPFTKNTKDLVMHVRLTDYWRLKWVIDPAYYLDALKREEGSFDKLYICTDEPQNATYFRAFSRYAPTIVHGTPESDFHFLRSFDRMIMANSTFSFWAQFLGDPSRVYTFKPWNHVDYIEAAEFPQAVPLDGPFMKGPIRAEDVTFIVPCMGRLEHLKQTLPRLASQFKVIVVDWSCPDKCGEWVDANVPQAVVVRVEGQQHFDLSAARNRGADCVTSPLIGFMDADTIPGHNFADIVIQSWETGKFLAMPDMPCPGYGGLIVCSVDDFEKAGRWDETAKGYGWEDIAFKLELARIRVAKKILSRNAISHIEHSDALRTANYEQKNVAASTVQNKHRLMPRKAQAVIAQPRVDMPKAPAMRVGMLCVATNKYLRFASIMVASAKEWLFKGSDVRVKWYIFSNYTKVPTDAVHVPILAEPWPMPTLKRYHYFLEREAQLREETDFLFYIDADMTFTGPVGHEILSEHTATLHPGFYKRPRAMFTYCSDKRSKAFVGPNEGVNYFAGGFQGGKTEHFLSVMKTLRDRIQADMDAGVKAEHNDESHWNRYCIDDPPTLILSPAHCYSPQRAMLECGEAIKPLITCVEKIDHAAMRAM